MTDQLGSESPAIADTNALEVETPDSAAESAPASPEPAAPERDKVQERFDKLTREKYDYAYRAESAEARLSRLERELEEARTAKPATVAPSTYPKLADYDFDEGKHAEALEQWHESRAEAADQKRQAQAAKAERDKTFQKRQAEFASSKPDYTEKVLRNPALPISAEMAEVIQESELGPQVAYYLAENLEQAAAISQMAPRAQAREIGRIEAKLEAARAVPAPVVSKAPPPPPKIEAADGSARVSTTSPESDSMTDAEWVAAEKRRLSRKRG